MFSLLSMFRVCGQEAGAADVCRQGNPFAVILQSVEKNNMQLKSALQKSKSAMAGMKSENTLGATSVEYSPFYAGGISGLASSELVVSQEMDFPTQYAARNKALRLASGTMDAEYRILRRDILLEAWQTCIDLWAAGRQAEFLSQRISVSDSLLSAMDRQMQNGNATKLDVNRIRMSRMNLMTEYQQNAVDMDKCMQSLKALNGGNAIDSLWDAAEAGAVAIVAWAEDKVPAARLENIAATADYMQARQEVKASRQEWLPKLTVGYRRNTDGDEAFHGFIVGASFSLFSASGKTKSARYRQAAAEWQMRETEISQKALLSSLADEAARLRSMLQVYDERLMSQTLSMLERAVLAGELSVADYYSESELILTKMQERLALEVRLQKTNACLMSDTL